MKTYQHKSSGKIGHVLEQGDDKSMFAGKGEIMLVFPWIVEKSQDWILLEQDESIVDWLKSKGRDSSITSRTIMWDILVQSSAIYKGTAEQNIKLLAELKKDDERVWTTMYGKEIKFPDVTQQHWSNIYHYHGMIGAQKQQSLAMDQLLLRFGGRMLGYKPYKPVLFKTRDGVEVFKNQTIYAVGSDFKVNHVVTDKERDGEVYFGNKEKAELYAIANKPMFSYQDLVNTVAVTRNTTEFLLNLEDQAYKRYDQ